MTTNFHLMQEHKYSLDDVMSMLPWERHAYISMLVAYIEEQNERMRKNH